MISTHVDDMAGYGIPTALSAFEKALEQEVELEKLGRLSMLLGMELTWSQDRSRTGIESVKLTQRGCIENMVVQH